MNYNLLFDNNLNLYGIIIGSGVLLGCSLYYLFKNNYINSPSENITNSNIDSIRDLNIESVSNLNIDSITDSDFETDVASEYLNSLASISSEEINTTDLDLFFMPDVDLEVCSIYELKLFEINSIYAQEIYTYGITEEELKGIIDSFSTAELCTNYINELILTVISYYHM